MGRVPCTVIDSLASLLKPKEYIYSISTEELVYMANISGSYRGATKLMNRFLHRREGYAFKDSTMNEHIESQGKKIGAAQHAAAKRVLQETPGVSETGIVEDPDSVCPRVKMPMPSGDADVGDKADFFKPSIDRYNDGKEPCDQIKDTGLIRATEADPDGCVYISIDDVGVRHQKDTRKDGGTKNGQVVENTVIHVQSKEGTYVITDIGMKKAFTLLMAYLFSNHLLENRNLYFFSDGAKNIKHNIEAFFGPLCPYTLILDWYHVEKRMTELLSMALKGAREERHEIRYTLDKKLWAGNFTDAQAYLRGLDKKYIRKKEKLDDAIDYLERKKEFAACYALRMELVYRNSSTPAEKANDLIVANRQKHNGMSWSYCGSGALATITCIMRNNEADTWITKEIISFVPKSEPEVMAS